MTLIINSQCILIISSAQHFTEKTILGLQQNSPLFLGDTGACSLSRRVLRSPKAICKFYPCHFCNESVHFIFADVVVMIIYGCQCRYKESVGLRKAGSQAVLKCSFKVVTQLVRKVSSLDDSADSLPSLYHKKLYLTRSFLHSGQHWVVVVGIRSALRVYSPSSDVKENLLRRPDEWGPFIFGTLKEKNHNTSKFSVAHQSASMVGKLDHQDSKQERKKLLAPTSKYSFLQQNQHCTKKAPEGGQWLGQGPRAHCSTLQIMAGHNHPGGRENQKEIYDQLNYFCLQEKQQKQCRENMEFRCPFVVLIPTQCSGTLKRAGMQLSMQGGARKPGTGASGNGTVLTLQLSLSINTGRLKSSKQKAPVSLCKGA